MKQDAKKRLAEAMEGESGMRDLGSLPIFLTAEEVAILLRTSRKSIYTMAERGQLPGVTKIGFRLLISRDDLLQWLDERRTLSSRE